MSITMNSNAGRKVKRGPTSPSTSLHHTPPSTTSPLPKIKLNIRNSQSGHSRASSSSGRGRTVAAVQRRVYSDEDSSSDLTPPEDEDDDDDDDDDDDEDDTVDDTSDDDDTEDAFPRIASRKGKKRDSLPQIASFPIFTAKDKGKGKATLTPQTNKSSAPDPRSSTPRPSAVGPNGRDRKRVIKLGEVARRRARDDKFGFGGADRFSGVTPTKAASHITNPAFDSDSTSSYGDDESERENTVSLYGDDTDDEMGGLPEAFAGQEIEDLAYGGVAAGDSGMDTEAEQQWWQEEEDDEDFIANLTGSDIENLQSQSSVHDEESDDPMTESDSDVSAHGLDEFGFPAPFAAQPEQICEDQPLVLMENWDGQFVLVQPRTERSRSRRRGAGSGTGGSVGESTSQSAGEQHLIIDADANGYDTASDSDWSGGDDDDGGDTTDSMAEEDMPVLAPTALDEIIGQQLAPDMTMSQVLAASNIVLELDPTNPSIVVTDMTAETPALSMTSSLSAATTPVTATGPVPANPLSLPPSLPTTPLGVPVMGNFIVSDEPCAHAVIDGSKTTTKSPFTRRRRNMSDSGSVGSATKRRSSSASRRMDPFSPVGKKTKYSSIPGHPRYIAARRAAHALVDLDRENTPSDEDPAFSLEDMLDASMLRMNDLEEPSSTDHLFRFDKVPVSMYMRRNFNSSNKFRSAVDSSPGSNVWHNYSSPPPRTPGLGVGNRSNITDTLADTLAGPANRMLISPLLAPIPSSDYDDAPMSRKDRRKQRKREDMRPLAI